ncbi:pirin family protein [Tsukamurella soli]|uniref:pirin family protein n=1 Tax=Tsukamurella soli TaxID=644556 RepID=UPI0031E6A86D
MSNVEAQPAEVACSAGVANAAVEVIEPRIVPLGGPRAMTVRRTLPTRGRSMVGAWCFADHYGPDDVSETGGMNVPPHPHTGLQTVSWLFEGDVEHRDSAGVHALVLPGELNLMSAGHGISHSEVSTPSTTRLHGVQLWIALPDAVRNGPNGFQHYAPEEFEIAPGVTGRVFIGALAGQTSPAVTATPLLGAELLLAPGAQAVLEVDGDFEHALLLDTLALTINGIPLRRGDLGFVGPGRRTLDIANPTEGEARAILLGGTPFTEDLVMWWNFVGRTHEEIVEYRAAWEARTGRADDPGRFGTVGGWEPDDALPAPPLPTTHLKPRSRRN